ncbi:MAG TPA: hypothetical protein PKA63_03775 [Oligoflexia bacterium]|nr:hypothetical protein [Oligoflexia bacterium]HMP47771.1 hypothetical protein [Oligoflexia bacterium]
MNRIISKILYKISFGILFISFLDNHLLACEVLLDNANLNTETKEYIIPVWVNINQYCVVLDQVETKSKLWQGMEKIYIKKEDKFGKFYRNYKTSGEKIIKDQYIYKARSIEGTEKISFISSYYSETAKYNKVIFEIIIRKPE